MGLSMGYKREIGGKTERTYSEWTEKTKDGMDVCKSSVQIYCSKDKTADR